MTNMRDTIGMIGSIGTRLNADPGKERLIVKDLKIEDLGRQKEGTEWEAEDAREVKKIETIEGVVITEETTADSTVRKFFVNVDDFGSTALPKAMKATCQTIQKKCKSSTE